MIEEIAALRAHGVDLDVHDEDRPVDVAAAADSPLKGKTVVITGAFTDPRSGAKVSRPDVTRLVEQAAATTASSVSASTDYLLAGANIGASKTAKADKLGVDGRRAGRAVALAGRGRRGLAFDSYVLTGDAYILRS